MLKKFLSFLILLFSLASSAMNYEEYQTFLIEMSQKFCTSADVLTYHKLNKEIGRTSIYIPMIKYELDKISIQEHLPLLQRKVEWIQKVSKRLSAASGMVNISDKVEMLNKAVSDNLEAKYQFEILEKKNREVINSSKESMSRIQTIYKDIVERLFYLKNFDFPVNHTKNRAEFEKIKRLKDKQKSNSLFFKRKIYEEGAPFTKRTSDRHVRMVLDNLSSEIDEYQSFISPRVLSDLFWLIRVLKKDKRLRSASKYLEYFKQWKVDLRAKINEYKDLVSGKKITHDYILKKYKEKSFSSFVYYKESQIYQYLSQQKEEIQKYYVLDTILYNEVGSLDPNNIFKADVLNTVYNRVNHSQFNKLRDDALILEYFPKGKVNKKSKWLNILFNKGEFSFTYHYFPAAKNIFCPPQSKHGIRLRKNNFDFFTNFKYKKRNGGNIFYYFSRISMPGRVDMSEVWDHAKPLVRRISTEVNSSQAELIKKRISTFQGVQYHYSFLEKAKKYYSFKVDDKIYAVNNPLKPKKIFSVRDEEMFKFFTLK